MSGVEAEVCELSVPFWSRDPLLFFPIYGLITNERFSALKRSAAPLTHFKVKREVKRQGSRLRLVQPKITPALKSVKAAQRLWLFSFITLSQFYPFLTFYFEQQMNLGAPQRTQPRHVSLHCLIRRSKTKAGDNGRSPQKAPNNHNSDSFHIYRCGETPPPTTAPMNRKSCSLWRTNSSSVNWGKSYCFCSLVDTSAAKNDHSHVRREHSCECA